MKKENSGITLLALIITIIIMLILAGVTISIVGGSDGIVAKVEKAVSQTDKAAMQEDVELSIAAIKMDYYTDYAENKYKTAKQFIVEELQKVPYETSRGAVIAVDGAGEITYTYKKVATKLTLADDGSVALGESTPGGDIIPDVPTVPVIPEGLAVGDTVSYSPSGTYIWQAEYASSDLATGESDDVTLTTSTPSCAMQDMSITTWKVYSIDETTGKVELVPSSETTNRVRLQGAQGYNNGVKLLNDACVSLYGDSSKGITARSINMEDIENALTDEALEMLHGDGEWGVQASEPYTINYYYPTIYAQEKLSVIDGVKNTTGLGMSEQTTLLERTTGGATEGKMTASTSIQPYHTFADFKVFDGYYGCSGFEEVLPAYFKDGTFDLLFPNGESSSFWVASRCVETGSGACYFLVRYVTDGHFGDRIMFNSYGSLSGYSEPLFPVVSLSSQLLNEGTSTDWVVK